MSQGSMSMYGPRMLESRGEKTSFVDWTSPAQDNPDVSFVNKIITFQESCNRLFTR